MSDMATEKAPDGNSANGSTPAARPRLSNREKVAKYRARKHRGIVGVVLVEVHENCLEMLAAGAETSVEALRSDRQLLASVARRALKYLARRFAELGKLP